MSRPVTERQLDVLRWIADGCPPGRWTGESHKLSARTLANRGLAKVSRPKSAGGAWTATLTDAGRHYLAHGAYPPPSPLVTAVKAGEDADGAAHQAIRRAVPGQAALSRQRRRTARTAALLAPVVKDIPMRYTIVISRVQTAIRHVRAGNEEEARKKIEEELARPYGFLAGWETVAQDLDLTAIESPLGGQQLPDHMALKGEAGFMLSLKAATQFLGVAEHSLRSLVRDGEIKHVRVGKRIYITRDQINDFLHANTHAGFSGRWTR